MIFLASLIVIASGPAEAPPAPVETGLAVMDLSAVHGVPVSLAKLLNEVVLSAANATGRFSQVIGGSDMRELLDLDQQKQALGCDDSGCIAAIGGALGVPYLLSCNLGKVGDRYVFTAKLLAVEEAKVLVRTTTMFSNDSALLDGVAEAVRAVAEKLPRAEQIAALPEPTPTAKQAQPAPQLAPQPAPQLTSSAGVEPAAARRPRRRAAAYSLIGLGGAVIAGAHLLFAMEDDSTRADLTVNHWLNLAEDRRNANVAVVVGSSLAALGGGLWWWGR